MGFACDEGRFWNSILSPSIINSISLSRHELNKSELPTLNDWLITFDISFKSGFLGSELLNVKFDKKATKINPIKFFIILMCTFCFIFVS